MIERRDTRGLSLIGLANLLLRRRRLTFGIPIATIAIAVFLTLVWPRTYTSRTAILPHSESQSIGGLAALAAQYGLSIPGSEGEQSPEFYEELLQSNDVLSAAVTTRYTSVESGEGQGQDLIEIWNVGGASPAIQREKAAERLRRRLFLQVDRETGMVHFSVTTRSAQLARNVAARLLQLLHEFNVEKRQTRARAEREFTEGRVAEARDSLRTAEKSLALFIEENRRYDKSPELSFEYNRLQREVGLRQQMLETLSQAYEQARIDEVRNTPVFTVVEEPDLPARADRRGLVLHTVIAGVFGLVLGSLLALGAEFLSSARRNEPAAYDELRRNLGDLRAYLWSLIPGRWRRSRRP